jgi:hypothetical protein
MLAQMSDQTCVQTRGCPGDVRRIVKDFANEVFWREGGSVKDDMILGDLETGGWVSEELLHKRSLGR